MMIIFEKNNIINIISIDHNLLQIFHFFIRPIRYFITEFLVEIDFKDTLCFCSELY